MDGTTKTKPQQLDPLRRELYDSYVDSQYGWLNDLSREGLEGTARHHARTLVPLLQVAPDARILEIGCGNGAFLLAAGNCGYTSLVGIDASPQQTEYCRQQGLDVTCMPAAEYLRDVSESYAAIVMSDVLEHMEKEYAIEVLHLCRERLEPGGRIIIKVPNMSNPLNLRTRYADLTHGIGFSIESLSQGLRATGFEIESIRGDYIEDLRWWMRWLFDRLLWWVCRIVIRKTFHLGFPIERGKNLVAVGLKPAAA